MQRGIVPGQSGAVGQPLEPGDIALGQVVRESLIRGVAVVNAAPQRPAVVRGAVPVCILPGACFALIQRPAWLGRAFQQKLGLGGRDKERVPIFLEAAAATAQLADWPESSDFRVELGVRARSSASATGPSCGAFSNRWRAFDPSFRGLRDG